ncbi:MAG: tetratricopeptide repeat protein [Myxococcota bacterium]
MRSPYSASDSRAARSSGAGFLSLVVALGLSGPLHGGCASWQAAQLYQSGSAALNEGDSEAAIADLEQAAALRPRSSAIQNHLGIAYDSVGRTDRALSAFERAVEFDCENSAAAQNLAATRRELQASEKPIR